MKKLLSFVFLIYLIFNPLKTFSQNNFLKEIKPPNLNSQDILTYLENNDLIDKVTKICSLDICQDITPTKIERDLKIFIQKNLQYLENKNAEKSLEASLKGFKISKIFTYS